MLGQVTKIWTKIYIHLQCCRKCYGRGIAGLSKIAIGGDLVYGRDYTLSPTPRSQDYPRVFSVEIPAGQATVNVMVTAISGAISSGAGTVVMTVVPYEAGQ